MELQSLQSQLKTAIQNHQIVLSKMRIDPQNSALQRQLHDLQAEIMTLSDKQKQVVQQLRTELERKQSSTVLKLSHNAQFLPRAMLGGVPMKLQAALKGGSGGVLLPQVVVVPSCSSSSNPSATMAPHQGPSPLPTLLAPPPIRVPQYPPCGQRLAPQQQPQPAPQLHPHQHPQQKQHMVVTPPTSVPPRIPKPCVAVLVQANSVSSSTAPGLVVPSLGNSVHSSGGGSISGGVATTGCAAAGTATATMVTATTPAPVPTAAVVPPHRATPAPPSTPAPPPNKEDHLKLELLGALGLMTREALRELQHRRGERKRRTTANPHFSNAALEEKRRNALLLITGDNLAATKGRQKGRARLDSSTPSSPEGSSSENTPNGHPSPPPPPPPPPPSLPAPPAACCDVVIKKEEAPAVVNGDVFRDWTRCATKEVTSSAALGWVSDYALLKSAKAEEKQKLLKRSLELKAERMQLEEKKQQLSEIIANQQKRRVELQQALQNVQTSLEKFEHVVKLFKEPS